MTLMDGMVNVYYTDLDELRKDLVTCINQVEGLKLSCHAIIRTRQLVTIVQPHPWNLAT